VAIIILLLGEDNVGEDVVLPQVGLPRDFQPTPYVIKNLTPFNILEKQLMCLTLISI